jgi:hypothetical protein
LTTVVTATLVAAIAEGGLSAIESGIKKGLAREQGR